MTTLDERVFKRDLVLVHYPDYASMLRVKSALGSSDSSPSTSSILVEEVTPHVPDEEGYWSLSDPNIYFIEESESHERDTSCHCEDIRKASARKLCDVLNSLDNNDECDFIA
ncbi:hypothetical protein BDV29DRAFT_161805 [Aspergillus leporis]|uniref:Uncharacterized protein n=1 Tax=Aspergillus leporis TaxID=41062 RepID=A0A5N5WPT4_9EURO|nr:hypothetical protein BDV29DRAFT_161805 [Aspergillus leporis]